MPVVRPARPSARRRAAALALGGWGAAGCHSVVDPPLPAGAVALTPPAVYARWWAMTEACAGVSRSFGDLRWSVVPGAAHFPNAGREANGYYAAVDDRVVVAGRVQLDGPVVRHEMLHALLRGRDGHPRAYFLARCGGTVACADACVADAGAVPAPPADAVVVGAGALRVTAELSPAAPSASRDDGWATLTVSATNAAAVPVTVARGPLPYDAGFGFEAAPGGGFAPNIPAGPRDELMYDPAERQFAAGETKRHVFDLRVVGAGEAGGRDDEAGDVRVPAGGYVVRGRFGGAGGAASPPAYAVFGP